MADLSLVFEPSDIVSKATVAQSTASDASSLASDAYSGATVTGSTNLTSVLQHVTDRVYLRICRKDSAGPTDTYYFFFSSSGETWMPLGKAAPGATLNNLWIAADSLATMGTPVPIQAVDWIRLGGIGVDPW